MPNFLVYIDVRAGRPTAPSLFALAEARRVARQAGASVFAVVATQPLPTADLESLARPIAEAGADKLLLCEADDFFDPPEDARQGRALDAASLRVPPMFFLLPPGVASAALGPPLAARLAGTFAPWCDFLTTDNEVPAPEASGRAQLVRMRPDGRSSRRLDPNEIGRPIVASLRAGRRATPSGSIQHLEIEVIVSEKPADGPRPVERGRAPNPHGALETAAVLVIIGDLGPDSHVSASGIAAIAPPDTAVVQAAEVPAAVVASCCPEVVLKVGPSPLWTARSPLTRVVLVGTGPSARPAAREGAGGEASPASATDDIDIFWQVASPAEITDQSLGALLRDIATGRAG